MRLAVLLMAGLALSSALVGLVGEENRIDNPSFERFQNGGPVAWTLEGETPPRPPPP